MNFLSIWNPLEFKWWGTGSDAVLDLIAKIQVRDTTNFNWTFIFILAVVFFIYGYNIYKKNWRIVKAGFALYAVHWLYEIMNAIIGYCAPAPLWAVSNESTTFILLVGVSWELSMMFSIAGMIAFMMLPKDPKAKWFKFKTKSGKKFNGISAKLCVAIGMALFFGLFETFLAATNGGETFIWYYKWWGMLPVFLTTYIPFFLAAVYLPDIKSKKCKKLSTYVIGGMWVVVVILLATLIPCKII